MMTVGIGACVLPLILILSVTSAYGAPPSPANRVIPLFTIGKSQNKNQVQYAIHVDDRCAPTPGAPVFAYWHMLELGPHRVAPLLSREVRAYGLAHQRVAVQHADGGQVSLSLRSLPKRQIIVKILRGNNGVCGALATIAIAGKPANLFDVYVKLNWHLGVDYLLLRGWSMDGTRVLTEKLEL